MARKHFDEYYKNVAQAYMEQNILLGQMLEGVRDGTIEVERVDLFKENIKPIVQNFSNVGYIKMLLDLPVRKQKHNMFNKMTKKQLAELDPTLSPQELVKQNEEALARLRDLTE